MNALSFTKRSIRTPAGAPPIHRFHVGQLVRTKDPLTRESTTGETYRITATLPIRDNALQYRIQSSREIHERVADESNLEVVASGGKDGPALADRTFRRTHIL
ncbi:hypothetical protein [Ensifer sp.]|uniref:hypothetical protein n=1 Tax=Ensifer sp. TaxID=1872086 RepID=UPI000DD70851|nr:hypothetical protein [Ensifer sp.]